MASVFKKLISKELGESNYNRYFYSLQKKIASKNYDLKPLDNQDIFNDIYEQLKDKDIAVLSKMLERLSDTMYIAMRISKTFLFSFLFYLAASIFIIGLSLTTGITMIALVTMCICFIYKTYEYLVNKYCFIDAHIILVYKSVLDILILKSKLS